MTSRFFSFYNFSCEKIFSFSVQFRKKESTSTASYLKHSPYNCRPLFISIIRINFFLNKILCISHSFSHCKYIYHIRKKELQSEWSIKSQ